MPRWNHFQPKQCLGRSGIEVPCRIGVVTALDSRLHYASISENRNRQRHYPCERVIHVEGGGEPFARFGQKALPLFETPAYAYVAQGNCVHDGIVLMHLRDSCFGGKYLSILSESCNLPALAHPARFHLGVTEGVDLFFVPTAIPLRDKNLYPLTDDLRGGPSEDGFRPRVEKGDFLCGVYADDRVGCYSDDFSEDRLGYVGRH
jgi:hypothetical protein